MNDHKHVPREGWRQDHHTKTYYDLCACGARRYRGGGFDWYVPAARAPAEDDLAVSRPLLEMSGIRHLPPEGEWRSRKFGPLNDISDPTFRPIIPKDTVVTDKCRLTWPRFMLLCLAVMFGLPVSLLTILYVLRVLFGVGG